MRGFSFAVRTLAAIFFGILVAVSTVTSAADLIVYKTKDCKCCDKWVDHMRDHGFAVDARNVDDLIAIKVEHGLTPQLASCHTAVINGYVIEGHVPANVVRRLMEERPDFAGLAVPGMPIGSPGMERADRPDDPYDILAFDDEGNVVTVYEAIRP